MSSVSISLRIRVSILLLLLVAFGMFAMVWVIADAQKSDNLAVNLAGRQRMLTQKIAKETTTQLLSPAPNRKQHISDLLTVFETSHEALAGRGQAPLTLDPKGTTASLPPPDDATAAQLALVRKAWQDYRSLIDQTLTAPPAAADVPALAERLGTTSNDLLAAMNKAVGLMQQAGEGRVTRLLTSQAVGLGVMVLFGVGVLALLQITLISPMARIRDHARALTHGEECELVAATFSGELREVADSLCDMTDKMHAALGWAQTILQAIQSPYLVIDPFMKINMMSQALLDMLQYDGKPEAYIDQNVAKFFYGDPSRPTIVSRAMTEGRPIQEEVTTTGRKGMVRNVLVMASPLYDKVTGKLTGGLCLFNDLTDLRIKEQELEASSQRVREAAAKAERIATELIDQSARIATRVTAVSRGASTQRERSVATENAMTRLDGSVLEVGQRATETADMAGSAGHKAREGEHSVQRVVEAMDTLQNLSSTLSQEMSTLGEQAEAISRVLNVISDIADQTNLLALNAAIEAARAGDAGRGFAVVADEVRKLAEKTMNATREVGEAIGAIQQGARQSIQRVMDTTHHISSAVELANQSGASLTEIVGIVADTAAQVESIASVTAQQSAASTEATRAVEEIRNIAESTAHEMLEMGEAIRTLEDISLQLRKTMHEMAAN